MPSMIPTTEQPDLFHRSLIFWLTAKIQAKPVLIDCGQSLVEPRHESERDQPYRRRGFTGEQSLAGDLGSHLPLGFNVLKSLDSCSPRINATYIATACRLTKRDHDALVVVATRSYNQLMASEAQTILEHALALPEDERRRIGESLLDSVPRDSDEEIAAAWREQVLSRIDEVQRGEDVVESLAEVKSALRAALDAQR